MTRPLVSIIIPTRNSARYLAETLDSVRAQTFTDYEIVIIDAASTDATLEIAGKYEKIRALRQESAGLGGGWNEGIHAAQGELVAFLDSDDLWAPRKLELQAATLGSHPELELVASRTRYFLTEGETLPPAFNRPGLLKTDHAGYFPGSLLIRKSLFDLVGKFNANLAVATDVDWFARIKDMRIPAHTLPDTLLFKRLHPANLSHGALSKQVWAIELLSVLKDAVNRKRNNGIC